MGENGSTEVRRCAECNNEIGDDEIICFDCYDKAVQQKTEDTRHPDDRPRTFAARR